MVTVIRATSASKALAAAIKDLGSKEMRVGWFDTAKYEDGTPVAYVAAIQEFGYPGGSIPARPFMRPTVEEKKAEWQTTLGAGSKRVLSGKMTVEQMLGQFGMQVAGDVGVTIASINSPPLSPITLLLRQHKKGGGKVTGKTVGNAAAASGFVPKDGAAKALNVSDKPLVDTGYLIQSVSSKVIDV